MEHLKIPAHGISIHALLAESDISVFWTALSRPLFLSTLSLRRATHYDNYNLHCVEISIHALLAESDPVNMVICHMHLHFYPRSPCGERLNTNRDFIGIEKFLSTLSLRRATDEILSSLAQSSYFYPRSPCGERHAHFGWDAGADLFLSTLSLRRATKLTTVKHCIIGFLSTLSLRRATKMPGRTEHPARNFYPRSPCGERLRVSMYSVSPPIFLSTLSLRRATRVSLFAPRARDQFLSTLSLRRATKAWH